MTAPTATTATRVTVTALLLAATACAPRRPAPGALAPVSARSTNETRAADLSTIARWEAHRVALLRNDGADLPSRAVALARAGAWLAYAREAYLARPSGRDADAALAEARALMAPLEREGGTPTARTALAAGADPSIRDRWADVERLASAPRSVASVASLAEAEIELVRATPVPDQMLAPTVTLAGAPVGAPAGDIASAVVLPTTVTETSVSSRACRAALHLARAAALLAEAEGAPRDAPAPVQALDPRDALRRDPRLNGRRLHFAVRSDLVGLPSAGLLAGVADALRDHPELSLVIEGHADPRGADEANRVLSGRRAGTVRDILADSGVAEDRMLVRQFGASRRAAAGTTALDYARDRRVQLRFVLPDGEELPITEDEPLDLQIERIVTRTARRRASPRRIVPEPR